MDPTQCSIRPWAWLRELRVSTYCALRDTWNTAQQASVCGPEHFQLMDGFGLNAAELLGAIITEEVLPQ